MRTYVSRSGKVKYRGIQEFPGYLIGTDGSVWSKYKRGSRPVRMGDKWWKMKLQVLKSGYVTVGLLGSRRETVHRLVLAAFVGPCPQGMECCHDDGDPGNNCLANLSWGTPSKNTEDQIRHGRKPRGEGHANAKLTEGLVRQMRTDYAEGISYEKLCLKYRVCYHTVVMAVKRKTWRHVT